MKVSITSISIAHPAWCDLAECSAWTYPGAEPGDPADMPAVEVFHERYVAECARWAVIVVQFWSRSADGVERAEDPVIQVCPRGNNELLDLDADAAALLGADLAEAAAVLRGQPGDPEGSGR